MSSHFNEQVIKSCEENAIRFVCLPPNTTHMCQPLDVAFFRSLKQSWRELLNEWKKAKRGATVTKDLFPGLLRKLLERISPRQKENLKSGFRKCGIYPLDSQQVLNQLPDAASVDGLLPREQVSEVFLDHLQELRQGGKSVPQRKRKRLGVEPGKSVSGYSTTDDSSQESSDETIPLPEQDDEPRIEEEAGTEEDVSSPEISDEEQSNQHENDDFEEGDYILVKYMLAGDKFKTYVGKIEQIVNGEFHMMVMRKKSNSLSVFVYPNTADTDVITSEQIMMKLPKPSYRRGQFEFGITLRGMFVQ